MWSVGYLSNLLLKILFRYIYSFLFFVKNNCQAVLTQLNYHVLLSLHEQQNGIFGKKMLIALMIDNDMPIKIQ